MERGVDVDGKKSKIRYNYFNKVITGGITGLKQHLAHRERQVSKCPKVSQELKNEMQSLWDGGKQKQVVTKKRRQVENEACKEEVFRPREVLSSDDDGGDSNVERARRESA